MAVRRFSHVIGVDDAPFEREHRGDVLVVGVAFAGTRPDGVRGGAGKWRLIERAGRMEPCGRLFVQRAGLTLDEAAGLIERLAIHGNVPEPLRLAHLIAGGVTTGKSRGRA